jgi:hypothetical protein
MHRSLLAPLCYASLTKIIVSTPGSSDDEQNEEYKKLFDAYGWPTSEYDKG